MYRVAEMLLSGPHQDPTITPGWASAVSFCPDLCLDMLGSRLELISRPSILVDLSWEMLLRDLRAHRGVRIWDLSPHWFSSLTVTIAPSEKSAFTSFTWKDSKPGFHLGHKHSLYLPVLPLSFFLDQRSFFRGKTAEASVTHLKLQLRFSGKLL